MKVDTVNFKNFLKLEGDEYDSDIVIRKDVKEY